MRTKDIRNLRLNLGKFLHDYYMKFGEDKYENLINRMGDNMMLKYGDAFTSENLRIMEAEYVTLNARLDGKNKEKNNITT